MSKKPAFNLIYLNSESGELGLVPDHGIANIGGVTGPIFTVGGRSLMFSDGTSSDGGGTGNGIALQAVYSNSQTGAINLSTNKPFVLNALNNKFFSVDAASGKVTISGDLEVLGSSTVIEGTISNLDQLIINPPGSASTALVIEPLAGVSMTSNLVIIRSVSGGQPVFSIDGAGGTFIRSLNVGGDISLLGLINGVSVSDLAAHLSSTGIKHSAAQISAAGPFQKIVGDTVEQALVSIDAQLNGSIKTWEHIQTVAAVEWLINHNKNSRRPTVTIYDADDVQVLPDEIRIVDENAVLVKFNTAAVGRAIVLLF